jgi:hypothetical protein
MNARSLRRISQEAVDCRVAAAKRWDRVMPEIPLIEIKAFAATIVFDLRSTVCPLSIRADLDLRQGEIGTTDQRNARQP